MKLWIVLSGVFVWWLFGLWVFALWYTHDEPSDRYGRLLDVDVVALLVGMMLGAWFWPVWGFILLVHDYQWKHPEKPEKIVIMKGRRRKERDQYPNGVR